MYASINAADGPVRRAASQYRENLVKRFVRYRLDSEMIGLTAFQMYVLHFRHFFKNWKNSRLTPGQNDDRVTRT